MKDWGPGIVRPWKTDPEPVDPALVVFATSYLVALTGSKVVLTFITHHTRSYVTGRAYVWVIRTLGILLFFFAVKVGWEAVIRPA